MDMSAPPGLEPSQPKDRANHHLTTNSYTGAAPKKTEEGAGEIPHKTNGAPYTDDAKASAITDRQGRDVDEARVIYDKHISSKGEKLTSTEPDESYDERLKHFPESVARRKGRSRQKQDPNDPKLASGRRAGAGWGRSAYEKNCLCYSCELLTFIGSDGHLLMFHSNVDSKHWLFSGIPCAYQSSQPSSWFFVPYQ